MDCLHSGYLLSSSTPRFFLDCFYLGYGNIMEFVVVVGRVVVSLQRKCNNNYFKSDFFFYFLPSCEQYSDCIESHSSMQVL